VDGQGTKRVALVAEDDEIRSLMHDVLEREGYATSTIRGDTADIADAIAGMTPDLVVFTTGAHSQQVNLLDKLRQRVETSAIPVVVLGTTQAVEDQAHASGNVHAVLAMPFDLPELLEAISSALSHVPFEARIQTLPLVPDPVLVQAANLLVSGEREIMLVWLQRIRTLEPFADRDDISNRQFLNRLPGLLNAMALLLGRDAPPDVLALDSDIQERSRSHAHLRLGTGISGEAVVREYQVLRDVIGRYMQQHLSAESVVKVAQQVNWLLDDVVRVTVAEYMRSITHGD
jgi:CheY-like chemotaxis protein